MKKRPVIRLQQQQKDEQFSQLPSSCVQDSIQQSSLRQQSNVQQNTPNGSRQTSNSTSYTQRIRQRNLQQLDHYIRLVVIKAVLFGLLIGFLVLVMFYDKLFYSQHYYHRSKQYQWGYFGYNVDTLFNMPNNELGTMWGQGSSNINNGWGRPQDPNAYHEVKNQDKVDKYNLQGWIMENIQKNPEEEENLGEYEFAVHLLQLNHNVGFNGELKVQRSKFEETDEAMEKKKKRLEKVLEMQKERYEERYQISKYMEKQLPFCVVVPSYNNVASNLYKRNIDSIFMQVYENYHVVYIDDASPDKTSQKVKQYIQQKNYPQSKINIITNQQNVLALANIYNGIHNHCKSGQIVILLDGDDSLLGTQVMALFNAVYQDNMAGLVYSRYLVISSNDRAGIGGSSRQIPEEFLTQDKFRALKGFFTSHLLTFYADLFWKVDRSDLTYDNGTFFKFAYDVALVTPIIQMVNPRIQFIQQTTYQYRFDTGINDPGWGQIEVDEIVFAKKKYNRLTQFSFIDSFYNQPYDQEEIKKKKKAKMQKMAKKMEEQRKKKNKQNPNFKSEPFAIWQ